MFIKIKLCLIMFGFVLLGTQPAKADIPSLGKHTLPHTYTPTEPKPAPYNHSFKMASVCFVGQDCADSNDYSDPKELCKKAGYEKTGNCPANEQPGAYCGYNSSYYDRCCNKAYSYTAANCKYPNYLSADNCSGRHKCLCDRRLYPVSNCTAPEIYKDSNDYCVEVSYASNGTKLETKYFTGCKCPDDYVICGKNQRGVGEACQSDYYASCECKPAYSDACYDFGAEATHREDFCLLNGTKYYQPQHCKTCANQGKYTSCPEGYNCQLEMCSLKYYITDCAPGYSIVNSCEWMKYFVKTAPLPAEISGDAVGGGATGLN